MTYKITFIPYGQISFVLPSLVNYLAKSKFWTRGRANVDDIIRFLYTGQMQLWVIFVEETENIHGYIITEIKQYPRHKMFVWQYGAGEIGVLENVNKIVFDALEQAAKAFECDGLEIMGRSGWRREAKRFGFTSETVMYEKFFNGVNS
jgi:hypothetical protein